MKNLLCEGALGILTAMLACLVSAAVSTDVALGGEQAQVAFPDGDQGRRAEGYIQAFNTGDETEVRSYLELNLAPAYLEARPMDQRMATYRAIKGDLARLEPAKVTIAQTDAITVIAHSATGKWVRMEFSFEKESPHRISGLAFRLLPSPPDLDEPSTPLTQTEALTQLEAHLEEAVGKDEFSGVVLIARGETPVFEKAYGLASKEYGVPNRVDTRFNIGSINKLITGIAIEQLAGKGALGLDDTIGKHLPGYPNKEAAAKATVGQLLDMTSGIGDFFGDRYLATPKDRIRDLGDYLPLFAEDPLLFEPGTGSQYSNGGYIVLGLVIEKVTGQSYFDYVRANIYDVAGMSSSGHLDADVPADNVASGYTNNWGLDGQVSESRRNNMYTRPARGSSAGGGYSTAEDLLRLVAALKAGRLSAPETSQRAIGGGFAVAGGANGINAFLEAAGGDYTIVVLSNYDPPAAQRVGAKAEFLLSRLQ